eukprot:Phypoly_transcript_04171.p1 GENE.Phypoly_transcript_04171~~Phypoly_transcript_04171.p1  ORF type:complete len:733 (+),score=188.12 Phypoly_transcript_04171:39-2237(+)
MLGRVARAAHRSSASLARNTCRKHQTIAVCRCYATASAPHSLQQDPSANQSTINLLDGDFARHRLPKSEANVSLLRAYEMVREAEEVITKQEEYDRAEAMLLGTLDFIERNNITDSWVKAAAQSNLGFVLHQKYDYQGALHHYSQGVAMLAKEPVRDRRFLAIRMLGYAELMSLADNNQAAESLCLSAAGQLQKAVGANDPLVGFALNNLASYMLLNGNPGKAVTHAERAFAILSTVLGKHNETTQNCAVNLSNIYKQLNRTEDLESLDAKFLTEDEPILKPETGNYPPEYVEALKAKWRNLGPRKIFDPPGLHRSAELSAQSYEAFYKSWTAKMPITSASAQVFATELRSLGYAFDKLPEYKKPELPAGTTDKLHKVRTGFEHLKLKMKENTSFARVLEDQQADFADPITQEDLTMTDSDWRGILTRRKEYQLEHGNPLMEGEIQEMEKSERFFKDVRKEAEEEEEEEEIPEESQVEESDQAEIEANETFKYLKGHENSMDWDQDTYNAKGALHGDAQVRAFERSKSKENPEGTLPLEEEEEEEEDYEPPNERDLDLRDLAKFTKKQLAQYTTEEYLEDARVKTTTNPNEGFGTGPSRPKPRTKPAGPNASPKEAEGKEAEGKEGEQEGEVAGQEGEKGGEGGKVEEGGRGEGRKVEGGRGGEKGKKDPYAFNSEEDDTFPSPNQKDRSHDKSRTKKEQKRINRLKSDYANEEPNYKHGRLHPVGWHDELA